jgi:hypothetical protein
MENLSHFLIVFDHREERLLSCREFSDADEAIAEYSRTEREREGRDDVEVVLIGSDSIETVKRTHANYFDARVASEYLRGL